MKNKLRKDLFFIKNVGVRLASSFVLPLIPAIIVMSLSRSRDKLTHFSVTYVIFFIIILVGLYLFSVWLFSDNNNETNK